MSPVPTEQEISIEARIDRIGKNMAFTSCFVRKDIDGTALSNDGGEEVPQQLLCQGEHLKAFIPGEYTFLKWVIKLHFIIININ